MDLIERTCRDTNASLAAKRQATSEQRDVVVVVGGDGHVAVGVDLGAVAEGFDVGLEMSGVPSAFNDMLAKMNHGGKIAMLGIPSTSVAIDWNQVIFKGLTIKGIYGREMFETWYKMVSLLQSGLDLSPIITHSMPIDDFQTGFDIMGSGQSGKVILNWDV